MKNANMAQHHFLKFYRMTFWKVVAIIYTAGTLAHVLRLAARFELEDMVAMALSSSMRFRDWLETDCIRVSNCGGQVAPAPGPARAVDQRCLRPLVVGTFASR